MKILLLALLLCSGCSAYHERFTYHNKDGTSHSVDVAHDTFLMWGRAASLTTDTQTEEFIRTVNANDIMLKPDGIDQLTKGIVEGIISIK